jgi:ABC-2 type transport system permease protein
MRLVLLLALKDLKLLFRDKTGLFWFFGFPLLMALFFGSMFGSGPSQLGMQIALIDEDDSPESRTFAAELEKSPSLEVVKEPLATAKAAVRTGKLTGYVRLPSGFGAKLGFFGRDPALIEIGMDPGRKAEEGYLQGILMETGFRGMQQAMSDPKAMRTQIKSALEDGLKDSGLDPAQRALFAVFMGALEKFLETIPFDNAPANPAGEARGRGASFQPLRIESTAVGHERARPATSYEVTFPQAVYWGLFGLLMSFSITLVLERRKGTLLRLRLAPLTRGQLLAGKGLACFLASLIISAFVLGVGVVVFGVRIVDPLGLVVVCCAMGSCYTGLMMLIANLGTTEQGVSGAASGVMMPLAMLGGGMIPLLFMPEWMRTLGHVSPVKWTILALEGVIWRGFTWSELALPLAILVGVGATCFTLGVWLLGRRDG